MRIDLFGASFKVSWIVSYESEVFQVSSGSSCLAALLYSECLTGGGVGCVGCTWALCWPLKDLCGDVATVQGVGGAMPATRHIVNYQGLCGVRQVPVVSFQAGKV
ncbi:hypothetical protein O3P69_018939 [Scylla paramamosain]|uniref:Uncharacterized protein n=1 Tax=Scylla paramamosain TaxID=85552 RepID=A0AAW0SBG0_SCYPA